MNRRMFLGTTTGGLVIAPLAAEAQTVRKVPRLCVLTFDPGTARSPATATRSNGEHPRTGTPRGLLPLAPLPLSAKAGDGDRRAYHLMMMLEPGASRSSRRSRHATTAS